MFGEFDETLNKILNSMRTSKATKKYTSKKTGITTTYTYGSGTKQLFTKTKTGYSLKPKNWKQFEAEIVKQSKDSVEAGQILQQMRDVKDAILHTKPGTKSTSVGYGKGKHYSNAKKKSYGYNNIDVKSMVSRFKADKAAKYIYNLGLTPEAVAAEFMIDVEELLNPARWRSAGGSDAEWNGPTIDGRIITLHFSFTYQGLDSVQEI